MKYVPNWFPGAKFKKIARLWGSTLSELTERPYAFVKHQMAKGVNEPSFLSDLLQQPISNYDELYTVKCSAMSLFTAGADTVSNDDRNQIRTEANTFIERLFPHWPVFSWPWCYFQRPKEGHKKKLIGLLGPIVSQKLQIGLIFLISTRL